MRTYTCDRCEEEIDFIDGQAYQRRYHALRLPTYEHRGPAPMTPVDFGVVDLCQDCLDDVRAALNAWVEDPDLDIEVIEREDEDPPPTSLPGRHPDDGLGDAPG